jgi:hypothetical protein
VLKLKMAKRVWNYIKCLEVISRKGYWLKVKADAGFNPEEY